MSIELPENSSCDRIRQLDSNTQVRRRNEQTFDEVAAAREVLPISDQEPMMQLAQSRMVLGRSVIADDNSIDPLPDRALHVLKVILESFGELLVRIPREIVSGVHVRQPIGQLHMRHYANRTYRPIALDSLVQLHAERISARAVEVAQAFEA